MREGEEKRCRLMDRGTLAAGSAVLRPRMQRRVVTLTTCCYEIRQAHKSMFLLFGKYVRKLRLVGTSNKVRLGAHVLIYTVITLR